MVEGNKVAILAGAGALHAREEVLAVAGKLAAPVIKSLPGKAVIPDDSEYAVGGIGLLGTRPGEELVEDCDTLFMIGTNFPYGSPSSRSRKNRARHLLTVWRLTPSRAATARLLPPCAQASTIRARQALRGATALDPVL